MEQYLKSVIKQFEYYKGVGEKAIAQIQDADLFWQANEECNSIATIVQHIHGNMLSRWTDFLTTDGEKEWRKRDAEFEHVINTREQLMQIWNEGWVCLFNALDTVNESNWNITIYIRNEPHTVVDAINRQLAHYPYHVGQMVMIAKERAADWKALTIPKGTSQAFNAEMFGKK
nr:DUF1572 family protein [uncultured Mucilaginibacter sp.]